MHAPGGGSPGAARFYRTRQRRPRDSLRVQVCLDGGVNGPLGDADLRLFRDRAEAPPGGPRALEKAGGDVDAILSALQSLREGTMAANEGQEAAKRPRATARPPSSSAATPTRASYPA